MHHNPTYGTTNYVLLLYRHTKLTCRHQNNKARSNTGTNSIRHINSGLRFVPIKIHKRFLKVNIEIQLF